MRISSACSVGLVVLVVHDGNHCCVMGKHCCVRFIVFISVIVYGKVLIISTSCALLLIVAIAICGAKSKGYLMNLLMAAVMYREIEMEIGETSSMKTASNTVMS